MKRFTALLTAVAMLLSFGSAFADTSPEALALAKAQVPMTAVLTSTDEDDTRLEFIFDDMVNQVMYGVELNRTPLSVTKVESRMYGMAGADRVMLTEADAAARVREFFPQAEMGSVFVEKDDDGGKYQFVVLFRTGNDNVLYRAKINSASGELLGMDIRQGSPEGVQVKLVPAMQAALAQVPGGVVTDIEFEYDDGQAAYKIKILMGGQEYEFRIDANTGEILKAEQPWQANIILARDYREDDDDFLDSRDEDDDDFFDDDDDYDDADDDMDNDADDNEDDDMNDDMDDDADDDDNG